MTVRILATMKKLEGAQSYVYSIMDKLGPIRETMAQKDDDWKKWGLEELVENLRKYTNRNPLPLVESSLPPTSPTTLHATVIAKVGGLQARIMLDSGAGSSYISSSLLTELKLKPYRTERRVIEQMYGKVDKLFEIYKVRVESNTIEGFELELRCINAEKPVWLWL